MNSIWLAFFTGLTTGGLSCLAVQGGLLASSLAQKTETALISRCRHVGLFLGAKLIAYTFLGFGLGLLGSTLTLSPILQGYMQIFAGLFMLLTAARILNLHPIFRYTVIEPPRWAYKLMRKKSQDDSFFAPIFLGAMTIFIPCGITQAMMVAAIATGNPLTGAAIMFAFTLGTSPVFFALGLTALELLKRKFFSYITVAVIIVLGILSVNSGLALQGSIYTLQNFYKAATTDIETSAQGKTEGKVAGISTEGKQEATIQVLTYGYSSEVATLKSGVPVKLKLVTNNTQGCTRAFTVPSLRISKILPPTGTDVIEFTPTQPGRLAYTCSMGMYTGAFQVIN